MLITRNLLQRQVDTDRWKLEGQKEGRNDLLMSEKNISEKRKQPETESTLNNVKRINPFLKKAS